MKAEASRSRQAAKGASKSASERVPGRLRRELQITDIGAQPEADAGADRNQHHAVPGQCGRAEAADEIGGPRNADETLKDPVHPWQAVDQDHGACPVAAEIEAERGALPIDIYVV